MKTIVTGGGGFLGGAVVERLLARGDEVVSISRGSYPSLAARGVRCVQADLAHPNDALDVFAGADEVYHVAAKAGVWGARDAYFRANLDGTRNVLAACQQHGVPRLVYTSSPSVCFDGRDHVGASNDLAYAERFLAPYPESKARAEELVLAANGAGGLATVALRPHLIFGPGDPHLIPRLLERARKGQLAIVGKGDAEVSMTFIDNAAHAHLCAARELTPTARQAGKAYFIAQQKPVRLWTWINELLERLDIPPVERRVPFGFAYGAGAVMESVWKTLRLASEPRMTRFVALQLARSHSYDMTPAREDFGYEELVSMAAATDVLVSDCLAAV